MEVYKGIPAFSGIAIGKIGYYCRNEYCIGQNSVKNIREETELFQRARRQALQELKSRRLETEARLLEQEAFPRAIESMILSENTTAGYAVMTTGEEMVSTFRRIEDPVITERIRAVRAVCSLLMKKLGEKTRKIRLGGEPVILMAGSLTPLEVLELEKEKLLAVVTRHGSEISHAAIMAKSMNLPSVTEIPCRPEWDGKLAIVDGHTGTIYLEPEEELLHQYEALGAAEKKEREELLTFRDKEDKTLDGTDVKLYANVSNLDDFQNIQNTNVQGIGLLRSEFQYLGRDHYPGENELLEQYKKVAKTMGTRPVVIRTVDLGADKQMPYMDIPAEENPLMGNRGIRLCLDRRNLFKTQLRAIYRASVYGNLAIMYPMIASEEELDEIQKLTKEVLQELWTEDMPYKIIQEGIMIETPAAVMISGELSRRVDFLCMGTNDLTQYTVAMDRQNPFLKNKYDDHHPAILRMIEMVVKEAHKAGCPVGICGEIGADTSLTEKFLRMGVDMLSVIPTNILKVRRALREVDLRK